MTQGISLSELARRIGRDKSLVSRWGKQGMIPRREDGKFDEAAVRRALGENLDPARTKPLLTSGEQSSKRSTLPCVVHEDEPPREAEYRGRADLGDDFCRGLLFGLHWVAFVAPSDAADAAVVSGASAAVAFSAHRIVTELMLAAIDEACRAAGMLDDHDARTPLPDHLRLPRVYAHEPAHLAAICGEPVDIAAWEEHARYVQRTLGEP